MPWRLFPRALGKQRREQDTVHPSSISLPFYHTAYCRGPGPTRWQGAGYLEKQMSCPLEPRVSHMGSPCGAQLPVCLPWSHADPQPCALGVGRLITAQAQTVPWVASDTHQVDMGPPLPLASHPECSFSQTLLPPALHWPVRHPEGREVTVPLTQQPA